MACLHAGPFSIHRRFCWTNHFHLGASLSLDPALLDVLPFSDAPLHFVCLPIPLTSSSRFIPVSLCFGHVPSRAHLSTPSFLLHACHPRRLLRLLAYLFPLPTSPPARLHTHCMSPHLALYLFLRLLTCIFQHWSFNSRLNCCLYLIKSLLFSNLLSLLRGPPSQ